MRTLQVASGKTLIETPDGLSHDSLDIFTLTDDQFAKVSPSLFPTYLVDLGDTQEDRLGGSDLSVVRLSVVLASLANATLVTTPAQFNGTILSARFVTTVPASTASKLATLTTNIAGTNTTGGVIALTTATVNAQGKVVESTAATAANTFTKGQAIGVKASSVTAFVEGSGVIEILVNANE